jgi:hypothetical protein
MINFAEELPSIVRVFMYWLVMPVIWGVMLLFNWG